MLTIFDFKAAGNNDMRTRKYRTKPNLSTTLKGNSIPIGTAYGTKRPFYQKKNPRQGNPKQDKSIRLHVPAINHIISEGKSNPVK